MLTLNVEFVQEARTVTLPLLFSYKDVRSIVGTLGGRAQNDDVPPGAN